MIGGKNARSYIYNPVMNLGRSGRRAPSRLTIQKTFSINPDGDGHVSVALHAPHALVGLIGLDQDKCADK